MLHNSCRHTYADGSLARKVVEVTSEEDVSVQGFNVEKFSADSYVILPWKLSGFEHYVMSYTLQSIQTQFAIVAMVRRVYLFINYTGINAVNVRIIKVIIDKKNIVKMYPVVAPCYQPHHKVSQLHATKSEPLDYAMVSTKAEL